MIIKASTEVTAIRRIFNGVNLAFESRIETCTQLTPKTVGKEHYRSAFQFRQCREINPGWQLISISAQHYFTQGFTNSGGFFATFSRTLY